MPNKAFAWICLIALAPWAASAGEPIAIELVGISATGVQARGASQGLISKTGRFVLFLGSTDLVAGQPFFGCQQWYLRDMLLGTTELVSRNSVGTPAVCAPSVLQSGRQATTSADVSADGRFVVFDYWATNIAPGIGPPESRSYRLDRVQNTVTLIGPPPSVPTASPSMDDSGRYVLLDVAIDVPAVLAQLQVHDLSNGAVVPIPTRGYVPFESQISGDGLHVVYTGSAEGTPATVGTQILLFDVLARRNILISVANDGGYADTMGGGTVRYGSTNFDGSVVAFTSSATNIVPVPGPSIVARLVHQGRTVLVSRDNEGRPAIAAYFQDRPSVSDDGSRIAFRSNAPNLPGSQDAMPYFPQVYVSDLATARVELVSGSAAGIGALYGSSLNNCEQKPFKFPCGEFSLKLSPRISGDGRYVAFNSRGDNLVPNDANGDLPDVYRVDLGSVSGGLPAAPVVPVGGWWTVLLGALLVFAARVASARQRPVV